MPGYDGEVRINTKIETKDAKQQLMTLQNHMNKTAQKMDGITKKMEDMKNVKVEDTAEWKKIQFEIEKNTEKLNLLNDEAKKFETTEVPTEEYKVIQKEIEKTVHKLSAVNEKMEKWTALGKSTDSMGFKSMQYDAAQLENTLKYLSGELKDLEDSGEAFKPNIDTERYEKVQSEINNVCDKLNRLEDEQREVERVFKEQNGAEVYKQMNTDLQKLNKEMGRTKAQMQQVIDKEGQIKAEGFEKVRKAAGRASEKVKKLEKETSKTQKGFSNLANTMKQMVLSMAVFTVMQKGMEFLGSGLKNLAVYSKEYNKSMSELMSSTSQLKNAFAAAFQPVLNVVIPILSRLISYVSAAANAVSRFFAILGGKSTYTKAIKQNQDYAASLGDIGGAAEEAKGSLAGFDELEVMQKPSTGSGGGGAGETDGSGFIEESVGDTEKFENIRKVLGEIAELFKTGFMDGLGDWESRVEDIQEKIQMIKKALTEIFTDPQVVSGAKTFAEALIYNIGRVAGSMASIGLTIAQNLIGGTAKYLTENTDRIKSYLIDMFDIGTDIANMIGDFAEAFAYVFEAFGSENGQALTANLIGIFADAFMSISELCWNLTRDLLNIIIKPFVDNKEGFRTALEGFLGTAATVCGTIKTTIDNTFSKLMEVYDAHFKPFFDNIANGLSSITGKFLEFWNTYVQPMLDEMATKFNTLMTEHIQPMLNKAIELLGGVADLLNALWVNILQPFIEWVIENILPVLVPIFEGMASGFMTAIGLIADAVGGVIDSFKGIIDFLTGVFTGDWEKAWTGISEWASGVWESLKKAFEAVMMAFHTFMNAKLQLIKAVWSKVWNAIKTEALKVWEAIKEKAASFIENIKTKISNVLSAISNTWTNMWSRMKNFVTTILNSTWTNIKKVINSIISGVEKMVNGVITAINGMINALNNISFTAPDWVPEIGGKSFGLNLSTINTVSIPRLANGGITTGSTLANIGEAGREAVIPLERNTEWMDTFAEVLAGKMSGAGQTINLTAELDGAVIYKRVVQLDREFAGRTGNSGFAYGY